MPCSVTQIVGNKRVATVNPNTIGVGNHGGRDIILKEDDDWRWMPMKRVLIL